MAALESGFSGLQYKVQFYFSTFSFTYSPATVTQNYSSWTMTMNTLAYQQNPFQMQKYFKNLFS